MPTTRTELTENEVRYACAYWVECGCPEVKDSKVYLSTHKGSSDPREPSGDTVTASVQNQPR
jgi:hypothetical protein